MLVCPFHILIDLINFTTNVRHTLFRSDVATEGRGSDIGWQYSTRLLGQGDPGDPSTGVALQGPGRDGQPPLPQSDGGSAGVSLHHPGQAHAPVVPGTSRLQHRGENIFSKIFSLKYIFSKIFSLKYFL